MDANAFHHVAHIVDQTIELLRHQAELTEDIGQLLDFQLGAIIFTAVCLDRIAGYFGLSTQLTELLARDFRIRATVVIAVVAVKLGMPAIRELLEVSLPESQNLEIGSVIGGVDGVKAFHNLRTRKNGNKLVLDFHIKVAPEMTIVDAHHIASEVERQLKEKFGDIMANIHIEPYNGENVDGMNKCVD